MAPDTDIPSTIPVEALPDAVVVADPDGMIVVANETAGALFGYAPGDVAGRPFAALVEPPEGLDAARPAPLGGTGARIGRRRDGRALRLDLRVSGMRAAEGDFLIAVVREQPDPASVAASSISSRVSPIPRSAARRMCPASSRVCDACGAPSWTSRA